jgi:hypothetical protein
MLAALVSVPLSISGLWVESEAEANTPQIDYSVQVQGGILTVNDPGADSLLDPGATKTIETWIRPSNVSLASDAVIIQKAYSYALAVNSGKVVFYTGASSTSWTDQSIGDFPLSSGQWYHVALVLSGGKAALFINGNQVTLSTLGVVSLDVNYSSANSTNNNAVAVGSWPVLNAGRFAGEIDQVKLWNSDRRTTLAADMHAWQSSDSTLPVVHWDFNAGSGTTVAAQLGSLNLTNSTANSLVYTDVKQVTYPSNGRTVVSFPRSYVTSAGGWSVPSNVNSADLLVVGGGGGGGAWVGAGGGGGGVTTQTNLGLIAGSSIPVKVGQGGGGAFYGSTDSVTQSSNGQQSSFETSTPAVALGGGAGASTNTPAGGGSTVANGGGGRTTTTFGQGLNFAGGTAFADGQPHSVGGGAGAAGNGLNGTSSASGAGGPGVASSISGASATYGGGGGGSAHGIWSGSSFSSNTINAGAGGSGGGGAGAKVLGSNTTVIGTSGTANTGGGGGGSANYRDNLNRPISQGGQGGSGVVIVSYAAKDVAWSKTSTNQNYASRLEGIIPHGNAWTVEMWIKPDAATISSDNNYYGIFSQMDNTDIFTERVSLWLRNGQFHYSNGGGFHGTVTGYKLSETRWYHIAMSSEASTVKIFIDGAEVSNATLARGAYGPIFTIGGARQGGTDVPEFAGEMDQFKVWNGALTAAQLTQSMHTHSTSGITSPPTLLAHYDFNEFVTGQVLDRSGNNRHLAFNDPTAVAGSYASTDFVDTAIVSESDRKSVV